MPELELFRLGENPRIFCAVHSKDVDSQTLFADNLELALDRIQREHPQYSSIRFDDGFSPKERVYARKKLQRLTETPISYD